MHTAEKLCNSNSSASQKMSPSLNDLFNTTPVFDAPSGKIQIGNVTNSVKVARALNLQEAGAQEEQMLTYESAIRSLESKCQMLQEDLEQMEKRHKEETTSLRSAVRELNAENEELANDVQELLQETDELQQTLQQVVRANLSTKESSDRLLQERDSLLEQLENAKYSARKEDPQEVHHWKSTMNRKLKLLTEDKAALENALSLASAEKDALSDEYATLFTEFNLLKEDLREKEATIKILQSAQQHTTSRNSDGSAIHYEVGKAFIGGAVNTLMSSHRRGSFGSEGCDDHRRNFIGTFVNKVLPKRGSAPLSDGQGKSGASALPSKRLTIPTRSISLVADKKTLDDLKPKKMNDLMSSSCPSILPLQYDGSIISQEKSSTNETGFVDAHFSEQCKILQRKPKKINPFHVQLKSDTMVSPPATVNGPEIQCHPIKGGNLLPSTHVNIKDGEDDDESQDSSCDSELIVGFRPRVRE
jgi:hypothetical protein